MKLLITASVKATEFELLKGVFTLNVLKVAARKAIAGLGDSIKSSTNISNSTLKKVYLTSTGGAGRAIFLIQILGKKAVLVMVRMKNDKQVGTNMTVKNDKFRNLLDKNLEAIFHDLNRGDFEEYEL